MKKSRECPSSLQLRLAGHFLQILNLDKSFNTCIWKRKFSCLEHFNARLLQNTERKNGVIVT